ncbi:MAG: flagellar hook-length control protein FliK, partial [Acidimicrobiales bacterium]
DSANQLANLSKGLVAGASAGFETAATTTNTGSSGVVGKALDQGITTASSSTGGQAGLSEGVAGGAPYSESTQTLTELSTSTLSSATTQGVVTGNPIPTQGVATGNPIPTLGGVAHPQDSSPDGQTLTNTHIAELATTAGALSTKTGASDGAAKDAGQPVGGAIAGVAQTALQSGASGLAQGLVGHIGQTATASTANASQSNPIPLPIALDPSEDQQAIASIVTSHLASNPALPSMLHLRVHPEGLGNVDLLISSTTNGIHVAISATSQALHGYLSAHAHELRSTLGEGVGVNVQIDLSYSGGTESGAQGALEQGKASQMLSSSFWGTGTTTDGTATTLSDDRARLIDIIA